MHVTIILGGWVIMLLKAPIMGLVILIILKTAVDILAHVKEHTSLQEQL